ncbi:MAG TPA: lysoplasmalogenase family protein, partial [Rhodanobacter sp.]|nr:lysoplasmalogenase family protein [Rhodanobacter sp.]
MTLPSTLPNLSIHRTATLVAAAAAILGALLATHAPGWLWLHWLGKPLATGLILALAWRVRPARLSRYRQRVLAGIAASLVGDVLLML